MGTVANVLAGFMIVACALSVVYDLRAPESLRASMERLKVPLNRVPLLALIKGLAAVGLLVGFALSWLTLVVAMALVVYFATATLTHLRVKDGVFGTLPAFVLLTASMLLVLTTLAR